MSANPVATRSSLDFAFVYAAYSLRYLYLLVLIPFYGRILGTEGYAVVLSALSLMNLAWLFNSWGLAPSGTRAVATASNPDEIFGAQFTARLWLALLVIPGTLVAIHLSPILAANRWAAYAAMAMGVVSAFNLGWYYTGTHRPRTTVRLEVIGFALNLSLILALVRSPDDADLAIFMMLLSALIVSVVAYWSCRGEFSLGRLIQWRAGLQLIRSSGYLFLYISNAMFVGAALTYLLGLYASADLVGAYGAADRLVAAGISIMTPMGHIFIPKITALFKSDHRAAYQLSRKVGALLLLIATLGAAVSHWFAAPIVALIFGPGFEHTAELLKLLAVVFPVNAAIIVLGAYLFIPQHQERTLAVVVIIGSVVGIGSLVLMGETHQATGAAYARVLGDSVTLALLLLFAWRNGILQKLFSVVPR
ncbi:oligosaccharide flippase family protein [Hydrogenophaga pseudoflava]|uniref:oligosaccharide flippase family protein n=1 Tax=Hydrogenophaga pseudoflava TaxID=47421 RepID=UPI0027E51FC4|nr:oligosaccharide flippase family protein [Hydrogenophaga pseudoflava]MDQ7747036.1 oligosaccharide flippase family protein [Hydrogenophaga pseudoflava]